MQIKDSVALVTGANRGIGRGFIEALVERGARRIYATARDVSTLSVFTTAEHDRISRRKLDIIDGTDVMLSAAECSDVTLLINNGGVASIGGFTDSPHLAGARHEMEVNFWGQLAMIRAFAPVLSRNGGGGILQILSIGALTVFPKVGTYCASKFAAHAMTKGVRAELAGQGTAVMAVFSGAIESDMSASTPGPKISAITHAHNCLAALEYGIEEFYPDFKAQQIRDDYVRDPQAFDLKLR